MTALATLSQLLPRVLSSAPGAEEALVTDELRAAAGRFCRLTEIWRETLSVTTAASDDEYALTPAAEETVVARILKVSYADTDQAVDPQGYRLDPATGELVFETGFIPGQVATLEVLVALEPEYRGDEIPAWLVRRWGEVIAYGALSELLRLPGVPWSNEAQADYYLRRFELGMGEARIERQRQGTTRSLGVRPC